MKNQFRKVGFLFPALLISFTLVAQAPTPPPAMEGELTLAKVAAELERINTQLRQLSGQMEAKDYQQRQGTEKTERLLTDLEMQNKALVEKMGLFEDFMNRALAQISPNLAKEAKALQTALDQIQTGEYAKALAGLQAFQKQFPKSPQQKEVSYWVAECRFALKDYANAIKDYQKYAEKNPTTDKMPAVLWRQGSGFLHLQMESEAKVFLEKLIKEYPGAPEATLAKNKLESLTTQPPPQTGMPPTPAPTTPTQPSSQPPVSSDY